MAKHDPVWLDRMYNNRALVPDHAQHFERWAEASAVARKWPEAVLDVPYGEGPGETLDVFPAEQARSPVVVFIHGGYWRSLDKNDHSFVAPAFNEAGACVVIPNYDLCPAVTIPDITLQMVKALSWTWKHAPDHGGDPRQITVIGHSAGGHLAAMMLACDWSRWDPELPSDVTRKALSISGLYELEPLRHTPFLQESLRLTAADALRASPARLPAPQAATLYTVAGADESAEFLRHNRLIREAWGEECVPVCEALPGLNHFSVLETLVDPGQPLHQLALELMAR
ncbi:MAG TPA: alpha/beta hydrolase [Ramlibacter sp.]|jgi:arylformamidase|uniref:alpha/beta hydrolase n=1 Tax=Ramlibacter sp. TaxID=1917967 RepID=UPI002D2AA5BA|nr:alpha/beta hydrolase [Ramlibacter sp.]HZY20728.1 alpha/beta hydrolase [Ramlibacter sp.]